MNALRLIYDTPPASIPLPEEFRHGSVEVIIMPLENRPPTGWPQRFFEDTAGSFADTPLSREPQGEYEVRDELK